MCDESLALKHSIWIGRLADKIKDLEILIDSQAQTNDEFFLRIVELEKTVELLETRRR